MIRRTNWDLQIGMSSEAEKRLQDALQFFDRYWWDHILRQGDGEFIRSKPSPVAPSRQAGITASSEYNQENEQTHNEVVRCFALHRCCHC